ncbi:type II toxin-antitoxin system VapC family toxin [Streptomyces griseoincarnatus]|uniref:type II toxin-antitoxin system VapC family toxin n=1 Tax=Streptomyces sp. SudanB148_2056 TaxID=3035280 RepID=UPI0013AAF791|nr:type II toxin-antitoxin system VapC family toxin [Streptomyces vinaceus]
MSVLVFDTSAVVEFLVGGDALADRVRDYTRGRRLAAPHAVDLETASVLRGLVRGGKLPESEAERALDLLRRMQLRRYDHAPLLPRIWQLRHNMWPYDAAYAALAEALDAELVTVDAKFAGIQQLRCQVTNFRLG